MIHLYTAPTPNGKKVSLMLEELGLSYETHSIDLKAGEQKRAEFMKLNFNGKIPVIVDEAGPMGRAVTIAESGAILIYLAEKYNRFLPPISSAGRATVMQWLMFQMAGIGPNFGNYYQFKKFIRPLNAGGLERFSNESQRIISVMEKQLGEREYLAGDYSIADIASFPWTEVMSRMEPSWFAQAPRVRAWIQKISARPAAIKACGL